MSTLFCCQVRYYLWEHFVPDDTIYIPNFRDIHIPNIRDTPYFFLSYLCDKIE